MLYQRVQNQQVAFVMAFGGGADLTLQRSPTGGLAAMGPHLVCAAIGAIKATGMSWATAGEFC
jgi:hypothetical protein